MRNEKPVYLTNESIQKMKDDVQFLRTKERARMAASIAEAREKGDLSENAEYHAAKEAQGLLEARIAKLDTTIANARLVDESQIDTSKAFILSTVKIKNTQNGAEQTYKLVSAEVADLASGRISVTSPIGKGLLGKSVGEKVIIAVPAGKVTFQILEISR